MRKPNKLQVMVTQRCNSKCSYCMTNRNDMDFDLSKLDVFKYTAKKYSRDFLLLFGGEPLIREDICEALVKNFSGYVVLPTNGILLEDRHFTSGLYNHVLISSNGTKESCDITGQVFVPHIVDISRKDKCAIAIRAIPKTASRIYQDFKYFYESGFRQFTISAVPELDWSDSDIDAYGNQIYTILNNKGDAYFSWENGSGLCVPYQSIVCLDQNGKEWSCAKAASENIVAEYCTSSRFTFCTGCEYLKYCYNNCYCNNLLKTGSLYYPYETICKFAKMHKEVFERVTL